jgi:hypothetical protein
VNIETIAWLGWTLAFGLGALLLEARAEIKRERWMREFWEKNFERVRNGKLPQPRPM